MDGSAFFRAIRFASTENPDTIEVGSQKLVLEMVYLVEHEDSYVSSRFDSYSVRVIALPVPAKRLKSKEKSSSCQNVFPPSSPWMPVIDSKKRITSLDSQWYRGAPLETSGSLSEPQQPTTLLNSDTIADARSLFETTGLPLIPIVDDRQRYTGYCANIEFLNELLNGTLRPQRVGGLATPIGVYLTTGVYNGGAGLLGLFLTGAALGVYMNILDWSYLVFFSVLAAFIDNLTQWNLMSLYLLQFGYFLVITLAVIRLSPLSGTHAAEHMTIRVIEQDLPLAPEAIMRQPRAHERCGTNLMVILILAQLGWVAYDSLFPYLSWPGRVIYILILALLAYYFWKPAGLWVQNHFTTKPPNAAQVQSGLKAGQELCTRFAEEPHPLPGIWQRIVASGMFVILAGFFAIHLLISLILSLIAMLR